MRKECIKELPRKGRRKTFDSFRENAECIFNTMKDEDIGLMCGNIEDYENIYKLYITETSVPLPNYDAVIMRNLVSIWWGYKEIERCTTTRGHLYSIKKERGATLLIQQNDDGYVTIDLYPAYLFTERYEIDSSGKLIRLPDITVIRKPSTEDFIRLYEHLDPNLLHKTKVLRSIWDDFNAYMEYTRLDGKSSCKEQCRIKWLRFMNKKGRNRGKEWIIQDPKVKEALVSSRVIMKDFIEFAGAFSSVF